MLVPVQDLFRALIARRRALSSTLLAEQAGAGRVKSAFQAALQDATRQQARLPLALPLTERTQGWLIDEYARGLRAKGVPGDRALAEGIAAALADKAPTIDWAHNVRSRVAALPEPMQLGAMRQVARVLRRGRSLVEGLLARLELGATLPKTDELVRLERAAASAGALRKSALVQLEERLQAFAKEGKPLSPHVLDQARAEYLLGQETAEHVAGMLRRDMAKARVVGGAVQVRKRAMRFHAERVTGDQTVMTAQGPSVARRGDWLLTGLRGEQWPVKAAMFERLYEPVAGEPGQFMSTPRWLKAQPIDGPLTLVNQYGQQHGKAGDFLITDRLPDGAPISWIVEAPSLRQSWEAMAP